ncbi:MAG: hypothetical protein HKN03_18085 [Acidimicrobiales bacterium]|nr:hypothetical protein [Acidimicrobiales bacterium]
MALSPDQLEAQEFKQSLFGSNKHEVTAFLKRVATEMRELEREVATAKAAADEARRSKEAAIAAAAQMPIPPSLATASEIDSDKFNELGDRIAGLLRSAEESAETIKESAEEEASAIRAEASELLEEAKVEADRIRSDAEAETELMKTELEEARTNLDKELEETREATLKDRAEAKEALTAAKAEVAELLAEARSQAEFIRHEADEIVRVKVRSDMETAEKRMRILQLTEQSSRDRLVSAQAELTAALDKLDADALPELELVEADEVLGEAHDRATRALTSGGKASPFANSLDEVFEPQFYENPDAALDADTDAVDSDDDADDDPDGPADFAEIIETQESEDDDADDVTDVDEDVAETETDEVEAGEFEAAADAGDETADEVEARELADLEAEIEALEAEEALETETETEAAAEVDAEADTEGELDLVDGVIIEDSISTMPADDSSPLDSVEVPDDSGDLMADAMAGPAEAVDTVPAALSGKGPHPSNDVPEKVLADEDPLAKLVREAMQRAVDSARGDDL